MNFLVKLFTAIFEAGLHVFLSLDKEKIQKIRGNATEWYISGSDERKIRREFRRKRRAIWWAGKKAEWKSRREARRLTREKKKKGLQQ